MAHISTIIPVFFKLFRCKDKNLREYLLTAIVGELKLANKHAKINKVNKKLQNFVFEMIKDPDEGASKRSLQVMITLYRKRIWNDENTVNVIAEACLHQKTKICVAAVKFFIVANYDDDSESDSEGSSEDEAQKIIN